jgi:hypothetical protein
MPPELRRERERTRGTKYEGREPPKKRATKKRRGKQPVKQPAKRKRQQSVNQADKPTTDADKAGEAAQQLVVFKKLAVARRKAAKAVPYPIDRQYGLFSLMGLTAYVLGMVRHPPGVAPSRLPTRRTVCTMDTSQSIVK